MGVKLGTSSRSGLSIEQVGGNDVYKMLSQIQSVLEGLGPEYVALFAEPVDLGRDIDWYGPDGATILSVAELSRDGRDEELQAGLIRLDQLASKIRSYAEELRASKSAASRNYADILQKALTQPGGAQDQSIFFIDGQPVLTGWGFSDGNNDLVEGIRALIKKCAEEIQQKSRQPLGRHLAKGATADLPKETADLTAEPAGLPEDSKSPEPGQSSGSGQPTVPPGAPPIPEAALNGPSANAAAQKPAGAPSISLGQQKNSGAVFTGTGPGVGAAAPLSRSRSWLPTVLVGAALLAAGALAVWYFLARSPAKSTADPSLDFLRGSLSATNVLVNESGENVDLKITFNASNGIGKVIIQEKKQSCSGNVEASAKANGKVLFEIGELQCPNKNNYEPFTLLCGRVDKSCLATNRNGETWSLDLQ